MKSTKFSILFSTAYSYASNVWTSALWRQFEKVERNGIINMWRWLTVSFISRRYLQDFQKSAALRRHLACEPDLLLRIKTSSNNDGPEWGYSVNLTSFHIAIKHVIVHCKGEFNKGWLHPKDSKKYHTEITSVGHIRSTSEQNCSFWKSSILIPSATAMEKGRGGEEEVR